MIIPFRHTALHVHPLFPGLVFFCLLTGRYSVLIPVLALLLHESGHLIALWLFHRMPRKISLTPFGGLIDLPENEKIPPFQGFLIAFAGPFFSFLGCLFSVWGVGNNAFSPGFLIAFFRNNLLLMLFNLLPALPLDGGRMVQALLAPFFPRKPLNRILLFLGRACGLLLIGLSVRSALDGQYQFAPGFAGLYVLYACTLEDRQSIYHYYANLIGRRTRMEHAPLPVQPMAVPGSLPLHALLPRLSENRYHLFHVLAPDGLEMLGSLTEQDFCSLLMEDGSLSFQEALSKTKKQRFPQ